MAKKKEGAEKASFKKDPITKKHGKKYSAAFTQVDSAKSYNSSEAFELVCKIAGAKFDETVDAAFVLGVDTKQGDQQVRGAVVLPHGTGKTIKIDYDPYNNQNCDVIAKATINGKEYFYSVR